MKLTGIPGETVVIRAMTVYTLDHELSSRADSRHRD